MKQIKGIEIRNIGIISHENITDLKSVTAIFGDTKQGKTTFLNSFAWALGMPYSKNIIKNGCDKGEIVVTYEGGSSTAVFKRQSDGSAQRTITLINDGRKESKAKEWLTRNVNPFIFEPDLLQNKSVIERKRFLLDICSIDVSELESQINLLSSNLSEANKKVLNIALPTVVIKPDIEQAQKEYDSEKQRLVELFNENTRLDGLKLKEWQLSYDFAKNEYDSIVKNIELKYEAMKTEVIKDVENWNALQREISEQLNDVQSANIHISTGLEILDKLGFTEKERIKNIVYKFASDFKQPEPLKNVSIELSKIEKPKIEPFLFTLVKPEPTPAPDKTNLTGLKFKLEYFQTIETERYIDYLEKQKVYDFNQLNVIKAKEISDSLREKRKELLLKLSGISNIIPEISVNETGEILFNESNFDMLSGSELVNFKMSISKLWKDGIDLEIIDKAGELGLDVTKSIATVIDYAKENSKHVVMSFLREKPACCIEEVGVFVIEKGKIN